MKHNLTSSVRQSDRLKSDHSIKKRESIKWKGQYKTRRIEINHQEELSRQQLNKQLQIYSPFFHQTKNVFIK